MKLIEKVIAITLIRFTYAISFLMLKTKFGIILKLRNTTLTTLRCCT